VALNIPMPESPGSSFLQGIDTGGNLFSRIMQPVLDREKMKQQQDQFVQEIALKKQAQDKANALLPYMIQQYQDTHKTAVNEAQMKEMYNNILKGALQDAAGGGGNPMPPMATPQRATPPAMGGQPNALLGITPPPMGAIPNANPALPQVGAAPGAPSPTMMPNLSQTGEQELRAGNPRLLKLDSIAGLVPGIPKPVTHYNNGMVYTTYPSGRMTVQQVKGQAGQTPGERNVTAKEASAIRDQAKSLVNSANLVQQGYDLLDQNPNLTGPGNNFNSLHIPFTDMNFNLSNNPNLGDFTTVAGKLQAELGKYAASRGGIQAVKWAGSVKPSITNTEGYNYGMFEGIQKNLQDDYNTLNQQYKAATGQDLPIQLPQMKSIRGPKGKGSPTTGNGKVKKVWKLVNGELV
jgi:hypothetical protein